MSSVSIKTKLTVYIRVLIPCSQHARNSRNTVSIFLNFSNKKGVVGHVEC